MGTVKLEMLTDEQREEIVEQLMAEQRAKEQKKRDDKEACERYTPKVK